jgi:hypothetical protein
MDDNDNFGLKMEQPNKRKLIVTVVSILFLLLAAIGMYSYLYKNGPKADSVATTSGSTSTSGGTAATCYTKTICYTTAQTNNDPCQQETICYPAGTTGTTALCYSRTTGSTATSGSTSTSGSTAAITGSTAIGGTSLTAYYPLDSSAAEESGNRLSTTNNGVTFTTSDKHFTLTPPGSLATPAAGVFSGSGAYISAGNPTALKLTSGTLSAWIKTSSAKAGWQGIITKQKAYGMFLRDGKFAIFDWSSTTHSTDVNLADSKWHHVAVTFQSGVNNGTILYIDGVATLTTSMKVADQNQSLSIGTGSSTSNGQDFKGLIDDARIYNKVLSASEIRALSAL